MVAEIYLGLKARRKMSRLSLDSVEWGVFRLKEIFEVENCKCSKVSGLEKGMIPYVGATNQNNGTISYLKKYDSLITKGNCIIFVCDGEGSMGYSYYKHEDFIGTTTIKVGRNRHLNKFNGMFISTVADTVRGKYNFGYKRNELRLKNETLTLPINKEGNPNWQFMEDYVKQEMQAQSQRIVSYYENKLLKLGGGVLDLEVDWKEFEIKDVFETFDGTNGLQVPTGSYIKKSNLEPSEIPRITVKETNNGIDNYGFSKDKNFRVFENFISVSFLGGVFYHPYKASIDMKVHALIPKSIKLDEYNANFLIKSIKNNIKHSSYGNQLSSTDLPRVKIMLPTDKNGEPHWQYMSNFIKKLEKENIEKTLEHIYDSKEA